MRGMVVHPARLCGADDSDVLYCGNRGRRMKHLPVTLFTRRVMSCQRTSVTAWTRIAEGAVYEARWRAT
jgi:hypothetical protein